jgi:hypothetical protein
MKITRRTLLRSGADGRHTERLPDSDGPDNPESPR